MAGVASDAVTQWGAPVWRQRALVPTLVVIAALVSIVSSLGAPLIPTIAAKDHVSLSTGQWLLTAALVAGALATPIMGRMADGPHQRYVVRVALTSVVAGCVLAAVVNSFWLEVTGRALQGVGLGLLPVTMAIARSQLPPVVAKGTIATLSIMAAIGVGLGYPLTSLITEAFGFHAAFWFGAVAVTLALAGAVIVLPKSEQLPARAFDKVGAATLTVVLVGVSVVLSEGSDWGWGSARILGLLAVSVVVLAAWVAWEWRVADPLVDLRQVRHRSVLMADTAGFLLCVAMYLFIPVIVVFVQVPRSTGYGFGASVLTSGLVMVPLSVATFIASRWLGVFTRRFGTRAVVPIGSVIFALSAGFFAVEHRALVEAFIVSAAAGLGYGFSFAAMPGYIVNAVPPEETGSATGFYQVLRSTGLSVGAALSASVLSAYTHRGSAIPTIGGYRLAMLLASGICVVTAVLSYVLPGNGSAGRVDNTDSVLAAEEQGEMDGTSVVAPERPGRLPGEG
jgi:MFS family permease